MQTAKQRAREIIEATEHLPPTARRERLLASVEMVRRDIMDEGMFPDGTKPRKMYPRRRAMIERTLLMVERYVGMFLNKADGGYHDQEAEAVSAQKKNNA